jgi:hypothetical protein
MASSGFSKNSVLKEIEKCKVLCENCHRTIHFNESVVETYIDKKQASVCNVCGMTNWKCIEFHHVNGEDKLFNISSILNGGFNKQELLDELNKCITVCANCHRKIHHDKD